MTQVQIVLYATRISHCSYSILSAYNMHSTKFFCQVLTLQSSTVLPISGDPLFYLNLYDISEKKNTVGIIALVSPNHNSPKCVLCIAKVLVSCIVGESSGDIK